MSLFTLDDYLIERITEHLGEYAWNLKCVCRHFNALIKPTVPISARSLCSYIRDGDVRFVRRLFSAKLNIESFAENCKCETLVIAWPPNKIDNLGDFTSFALEAASFGGEEMLRAVIFNKTFLLTMSDAIDSFVLMREAVKHGNLAACKFLINNARKDPFIPITRELLVESCARNACQIGNVAAFMLVAPEITIPFRELMPLAVAAACEGKDAGGGVEICELLLSRELRKYDKSDTARQSLKNSLLMFGASNGRVAICELARAHGANNFNGMAEAAIHGNQRETYNLAIKFGATIDMFDMCCKLIRELTPHFNTTVCKGKGTTTGATISGNQNTFTDSLINGENPDFEQRLIDELRESDDNGANFGLFDEDELSQRRTDGLRRPSRSEVFSFRKDRLPSEEVRMEGSNNPFPEEEFDLTQKIYGAWEDL